MEVTLKRAWEALSIGERLDLGRSLVQLAFQRSGVGGRGNGGGGEGGLDAAGKVRRRKGIGHAGSLLSRVPGTRSSLVVGGGAGDLFIQVGDCGACDLLP